MSELIQSKCQQTAFRLQLLAGASALVLSAQIAFTNNAQAADNDRPTVWIELGGQLNRLENGQETFQPPFLATTASMFPPPQGAERPPRHGFDENASVLIQPEGSTWTFAASLRYGRTGSNKRVHHQSYPESKLVYRTGPYGRGTSTITPSAARFTDVKAVQGETHMILDFRAGRDVGLGVFGRGGSSTLGLGIRFAQFTSKSRIDLGADSDWQFVTQTVSFYGYRIQNAPQRFHNYEAHLEAERSFHGIGPSLSWQASAPVAGTAQDGELTIDWGLNAAVLFGRQKAKTHHQTTGHYHPSGSKYNPAPKVPITTYQHPATPDHQRSRGVTVPNVGGFAGLSFRYDAAKLSFGYRADFFFGAMDGGIDTGKSYDRDFYGPYATLSIGLGG